MAASVLAGRIFLVAWVFLGVATGIGTLLRMHFVFPIPGFPYGNFLHAHSHVAFLGWVYNAFFALAVQFFVPAEHARRYWRFFLGAQVAVVGLMISFPIQGYARESIAFSTLHMVFSVVFMASLLRRNVASPVARAFLWAASLFLFASCLGPLAVGPIMALGLHDTPWHGLSIGYYLHFQYNGWFVFFLLAVHFEGMHRRGATGFEGAARCALGWLAAGCVLTFALAALPMSPPLWVYVTAGGGAVLQVIGCWYLLRSVREGTVAVGEPGARLLRWLAACALLLFLLKVVLQLLASWPGLEALATNRFTVVAFMHLIFLGVVTPMLIAWAFRLRWIRLTVVAQLGVGLLAMGAFGSQLALGYTPIAATLQWPDWPGLFGTLFVAAFAIFIGVAMVLAGFRGASANVSR